MISRKIFILGRKPERKRDQKREEMTNESGERDRSVIVVGSLKYCFIIAFLWFQRKPYFTLIYFHHKLRRLQMRYLVRITIILLKVIINTNT